MTVSLQTVQPLILDEISFSVDSRIGFQQSVNQSKLLKIARSNFSNRQRDHALESLTGWSLKNGERRFA